MASGNSGSRRATTRKKTAVSKKTGGRNTGKRAAAKRREEDAFIRDEVIVLVLFAVSILLLLSNFGIGGAAGNLVSSLMFGLFGVFAYVLPVVLFLVTAFSISNRDNTIAAVKVGAMIVAGFLLCALFQLVGGAKDDISTAADFYAYSAEHKTGGGFFGGIICKVLTGAFGTVGSWIILLVLFIICAVIITERSFIGGVRTGSKKVYDTAREDAIRHRKLAEERREARRQAQEEQEAREEEECRKARIEHRVSGVALGDTAFPKPEPDSDLKPELSPSAAPVKNYTDEMREITLPDADFQKTDDSFSESAGLESSGSFDTQPDLKDLDDMFRIPIHRARSVPEPEPEQEPDQEEEFASYQEAPVAEPTVSPAPIISKSASSDHPRTPSAESHSGSSGSPVSGITGKPAGQVKEQTSGPVPDHTVPQKRMYIYPPLRLLNQVRHEENKDTDRILHETAIHLQQILRDFGVGVTVTDVSQGPAVTRYELQPDQGVKVNKIVSLADDIKLNLAVTDVRIEAPIPGKAAVGIEVPNAENSIVSFRELVSSQEFKNHKSKLAFAVGKDIAGKIMVTDIAKMPHLLIAGATGSGKSVCINTLIMSILYKAEPDEVKLIMIDPKVVELSTYNGIPHLLIPVVTDPKKAAGALNWAVAEMTHRYKLFAEYNVRNLAGYNEKIRNIEQIQDDTKPQKLPQIVIVVDELADLMMVAPGEVEDAICRLAQLARAAGIHLIIATQRPSVNVITGLIKANMPSRIAFAVSSGVDSRTILDMNGAEKLLGKGDMLFYPYGYPKPVRVQGAFVSDEEVSAVVEFLKENNTGVTYRADVEEHINAPQTPETEIASGSQSDSPERDPLFAEAGKFIIEKDKASIGMLQRWFKVGFNRAARIMDQLSDAGVVGEEAGTKPREILMTMEEFERYLEEYA